jgi:hypothetical protein
MLPSSSEGCQKNQCLVKPARPDTPDVGYIALQNVIENAIFRAGVNSE